MHAASICDRKYRPKDSLNIGEDKSINDGLMLNATDDVADLLSRLYLKCETKPQNRWETRQW